MASLFSSPLLADLLLELQGNKLLLVGAAAAGLLFLLLVAFLLLRGKGGRNPESGLAEDLSTYPPPPKDLGTYRVTVMTQPGRLRLVVVAPVGKKPLGEPEAV